MERASSNVDSEILKKQPSQHTSNNCSRQCSQEKGEVSKNVKMFESDELVKSRMLAKNSAIFPVEAEVHDESEAILKQYLPPQIVAKCFSPLKGELNNEFYDLPPFENSYRNSIESLYSTLSRKDSQKGNVGFLKKALAASATTLTEDCDFSLVKHPGCLKSFEDESPKTVATSVSLDEYKLKYSTNLKSFESLNSTTIDNSYCFGSSMPVNTLREGIKKAAKSLFKKTNSSTERSDKTILPRYMSFVNDKENWFLDPNDTILRRQKSETAPEKIIQTNLNFLTSLMETKVTQTDFSDNEISCVLESALETSAVSTTSQHFKETQTEFSPHDSSLASLDSENENFSSISQTSGVYMPELNRNAIEATLPENAHSAMSGETTTDAYFNNNTLPFTEGPTDFEDGLGVDDTTVMSNQNNILPDMNKRIDNAKNALNNVVSRFTCLDEVLNSYQQTIKDLPSGSISDVSLSASRKSFDKTPGSGTCLNALKRSNYKLSPLSSPSRKKDRIKDFNDSISQIPDSKTLQSRRALHSTPTLPESSEMEAIISDEMTRKLKKELVKEIQMRNLKVSLGTRNESWSDNLSVGSEDVFMAPLAASESLATISSAKLSQSFQQESFFTENRNSSYCNKGIGSGKEVSSSSNGDPEGTRSKVSVDGIDSDAEEMIDYDEQYNNIKQSYQNLSALNYAFMDYSDAAENDSLDVYGADPCYFNAEMSSNKNMSSSSDSYHSPEGTWIQTKDPKDVEPESGQLYTKFDENLSEQQTTPKREDCGFATVADKKFRKVLDVKNAIPCNILGEVEDNCCSSRSQKRSSVDMDDSDSSVKEKPMCQENLDRSRVNCLLQ